MPPSELLRVQENQRTTTMKMPMALGVICLVMRERRIVRLHGYVALAVATLTCDPVEEEVPTQ